MDLHSAPGIRAAQQGTRGPLRVLFIDHETRLSGGQQDLVDLIGSLDRARAEPHVALPGEGALAEALRVRGATVHLLPMAHGVRDLSRHELMRRPHHVLGHVWGSIRSCVAIWRLIGRTRPALVHTNSMKAHLLAAGPAWSRRVPLVMHVRDILPAGWLRRLMVITASLFARRVVCLSAVTARQFDGSRAARKTVVVHNGIALERFRGPLDRSVRASLGAPNGEVLIGMVGQIAYWKGQDVFVDAAALIAAAHPRARFVVIGECLFPGNEASFDQAVRERARSAGLNGNFTWTGWMDDVGSAVAALDVLVHASREPEPFGRVLVEGMAAGKPVVTTTIGAGPEIVPADAGRLVAPGDPAVLASALAQLVADVRERKRCGAAARAAAQRFDIAHTARSVERLYAEIEGSE